MIRFIDFELSPVEAGAERWLVVHADGDVGISSACFLTAPPSGHCGCAECGTIHTRSGRPVRIVASASAFRDGGVLDLLIADLLDGDSRIIELEVTPCAADSRALAG